MTDLTGAERLVAQPRAVTIAGLVVLSLLAWLYLLFGAGMKPMDGMAMAPTFPLVAAMWWAMMVAMMVPSAAPAILLYGRVHRHSQSTPPPTAAFLAGYLACWFVFSAGAAWFQIAATSPVSLALDGQTASGGLLVAVGLHQLSPLKDACLSKCRAPTDFLTRHYRAGASGAWRLGLIHGAYCIGCCWLLMAMLFVVGVMNFAWIVALTMLVAAEKLLPGGRWVARIAGVAMIAWGVIRMVG